MKVLMVKMLFGGSYGGSDPHTKTSTTFQNLNACPSLAIPHHAMARCEVGDGEVSASRWAMPNQLIVKVREARSNQVKYADDCRRHDAEFFTAHSGNWRACRNRTGRVDVEPIEAAGFRSAQMRTMRLCRARDQFP